MQLEAALRFSINRFSRRSPDLYDMQKVQNNQYNHDNEQNMDPAACFWKSWTNVPTEKAEQPQDNQDHDDGPQHEISPFE
jgi:hypothetical protein